MSILKGLPLSLSLSKHTQYSLAPPRWYCKDHSWKLLLVLFEPTLKARAVCLVLLSVTGMPTNPFAQLRCGIQFLAAEIRVNTATSLSMVSNPGLSAGVTMRPFDVRTQNTSCNTISWMYSTSIQRCCKYLCTLVRYWIYRCTNAVTSANESVCSISIPQYRARNHCVGLTSAFKFPLLCWKWNSLKANLIYSRDE